MDGLYRPYAEWQKLSPEQRASILEAREKERSGKDEVPGNEKDKETGTTETGKGRQPRNKRRTRRQVTNPGSDQQDGDGDPHGDGDPL